MSAHTKCHGHEIYYVLNEAKMMRVPLKEDNFAIPK